MIRYWCNRVVQIGSEFDELKVAMGHFIPFAAIPGMRNGELGGKSWDTSKPHVVILDDNDDKHIMMADFSVNNFRIFVKKFFDGNVRKFKLNKNHDEL